MKESECPDSCRPHKQERAIKNFSIFFDVADGMNLCGRNVAFSVREGMNLIESERMDKKSRCFAFELKTPEKGKKNGMPVAIRTRDLLLRRQTLYPTELRAHTAIKFNIT